MVRVGRLELPRRKTLEPKSSASTNSATLAHTLLKPTRIALAFVIGIGVGEGDRTLDRRNHNPELYRLSYAHHYTDSAKNGAPGRIRTYDPRLRRPLLYPTELRALEPRFYLLHLL